MRHTIKTIKMKEIQKRLNEIITQYAVSITQLDKIIKDGKL